MSTSRAKGTAFETAIVDYLRDHGAPHAERRALGGAKDRGDIAGTPGFVWEAKNAKRIELATWVDEMLAECANDGSRLGAVIIKRSGKNVRRAYAVCQLDQLCMLLRQAGYLDGKDS